MRNIYYRDSLAKWALSKFGVKQALRNQAIYIQWLFVFALLASNSRSILNFNPYSASQVPTIYHAQRQDNWNNWMINAFTAGNYTWIHILIAKYALKSSSLLDNTRELPFKVNVYVAHIYPLFLHMYGVEQISKILMPKLLKCKC